MLDVGIDIVFLGCKSIVAIHVDSHVRVVDGCESFDACWRVGAIYLDVSETIFVIVESADVSFGYDVLLVAASLDVGSNLAKARVV